VLQRRCRAGVCRGLIRHRITDPAAPALAEAARLCPSAAIVPDSADGGEPGWLIDDAACVQCGLCLELAPEAVLAEDRFPAAAAARGDVPAPAVAAGA